MTVHRAALLLVGGLAVAGQSASAQSLPLEQGINFSLKPRQGFMTVPRRANARLSARIDPIKRIEADDRGQDIRISVQRLSQLASLRGQETAFSVGTRPRTRLSRYVVEEELLVGPHVVATFGWHGAKISNRSAGLTEAGGDGRLRARDWFLPRAAVRVRPSAGLTLALGYTETLRGYGDTGALGPLGLDRSAFLSLRNFLKPETQSRTQLRADWVASPAIALSLAVHRGRLDDRLDFLGRGTLPVNSGSARIEGAVLEASHRLTPHLAWSLRYDQAQLQVAGGDTEGERSVALAALWAHGPWQMSARLAHSSAASLALSGRRGVRMEAGVDRRFAASGGRALRLSLRLQDPDRLASTAFARDDLSGPVRAADQARAVMAGLRFDW